MPRDLDICEGRGRVLFGEALERLRDLPDESVQTVVTSPPYWQLRDYGHPDQLGLEATPAEFVERMVGIFREARRVLRSDGTLWLNLGDTYVGGRNGGVGSSSLTPHRNHSAARAAQKAMGGKMHREVEGLKPKDMVGIPWRAALALQDDGWWLRSEIIWNKPSAMPESVRDRPTRAHEHVFLLSKSRHYHYDADAIRTPLKPKTYTAHGSPPRQVAEHDPHVKAANWAKSKAARRVAKKDAEGKLMGANARTVWTIAQEPWHGKHTSTFPRKLARRCILAGCPVGGTVLDPFLGSGTTMAESLRLGRKAIGIEIAERCREEIESRLEGLQLPLVPEAC